MASGLASFNARRNVRAPAMMVSTIQGSSITTASITATAITMSTLTGSTISAPSISVSSLTGSTITSNMLSLSTLTVSSINSGAPGVEYSTMNVSSLNVMSSITTSSITASSITTASGFNSISNIIYTTSGMQVGIGTTNPSTTLHVATSTTDTISGVLSSRYYLSGPGDNQDASGTNFDGPWYGLGWSGIAGLSGNPYVCLAGFYGVALRSGSGFLQLAETGNVGIGTTNPAQLLHVYGTNPYFYLGGTATNYNVGQFSFNTVSAGSTSNYVSLQIYNGPATLCFTGIGYVGMGTTNPSYLLHGYGNIDGGVVQYFENASSGTSAWALIGCKNDASSMMLMYLNSSTRTDDGGQSIGTVRNNAGSLRLQSAGANASGNIYIVGTTGLVGIGKTNPGYLLDVNGGIQSNGTSKIVIQNSVNGGTTAGIMYWTIGNTDWVSYMATSGGGTSALGGTGCTGAFGFTSHAIRNRVYNYGSGGFIWENSSETCLMSIRGDGAGGGMIGSWGVNTLSPAYTLDVNGSSRATQVYTDDWFRVNTTGGLHWQLYSYGIWSPQSGSNDYGNISTYGTGRNSWSGYGAGTKACFMVYNPTGEFGIHDNTYSWAFFCDGTTYRRCTIGGSVLCSQTGDRFVVFVNGVNHSGSYFYVNNGGGYGIYSDERIKKNIEPIAEEPSITFIKNLQPSIFCLKEEPGKYKHCAADGSETGIVSSVCNCEQSGFIAQNVLAAAALAGIPKSVCNKWYDYEQELGLPDEERKTILGVSTVPIVSHLTNAVKSLIGQYTSKATRITACKSKITSMLSRLNVLEAR